MKNTSSQMQTCLCEKICLKTPTLLKGLVTFNWIKTLNVNLISYILLVVFSSEEKGSLDQECSKKSLNKNKTAI